MPPIAQSPFISKVIVFNRSFWGKRVNITDLLPTHCYYFGLSSNSRWHHCTTPRTSHNQITPKSFLRLLFYSFSNIKHRRIIRHYLADYEGYLQVICVRIITIITITQRREITHIRNYRYTRKRVNTNVKGKGVWDV